MDSHEISGFPLKRLLSLCTLYLSKTAGFSLGSCYSFYDLGCFVFISLARLHLFYLCSAFLCYHLPAFIVITLSHASTHLLAGGQESGQSAAAAVTAACGLGRCYAKGGSPQRRRRSWTTQPAPPLALHSLSPATTTAAPLNGWPWTGRR